MVKVRRFTLLNVVFFYLLKMALEDDETVHTILLSEQEEMSLVFFLHRV